MFEQMKWEEVYQLWKHGAYYFPQSLSTPLPIEKVAVEYSGGGYFYGYDWLENTEAEQRKKMIQTNVAEFLYFTKPTNKGTIQTIEMLSETIDEEERAAIWIAATAFELQNKHYANDISTFAYQMYNAAWEFLRERFYMWHHAMKRLVPDVLIPHNVLKSMSNMDADTVMKLIQMNTLMIKGSHSVLLYSSLKDDSVPERGSVRLSANRR